MANVKLTITNIAKGPRGVNAVRGGTVLLEAGQTAEVEVTAAEAADLSKEWFETTGGKVKAEPPKDPPKAGPEAKHRGGGSYSIMDGDKELREKLTKEQAEAFNALDADARAKWLADNPATAA